MSWKPAADHPWRKIAPKRKKAPRKASSYDTFEPRINWKGRNAYQRIMQVLPDSIGE